MIYPVSECFQSFQGEGSYAGTSMFFIRLAGCTVGKRYPKERYKEEWRTIHGDCDPTPLHLPIYTEECSLYDGRKMACDTDYRKKERVDEKELVNRIPVNMKYVCITGGEPMMHDLAPLVDKIIKSGRCVHLETSGTRPVQECIKRDVWVTVSPKLGLRSDMIDCADELKFLVDAAFDPVKPFNLCNNGEEGMEVSPFYLAIRIPSYLQPVNYENKVNAMNLKLCLEIQAKHPVFRISPQVHKMVGHFVGEIIR